MNSASYGTVTAVTAGPGFTTTITSDPRGDDPPTTTTADVPTIDGGSNAGPSPTRLLLGALASCKAMTGRAYASRKGWPLQTITVRVSHDKRPPADDPSGEPVDHLDADVELSGDLTDEQRERILTMMERCHVQQILLGSPKVTSKLAAAPA